MGDTLSKRGMELLQAVVERHVPASTPGMALLVAHGEDVHVEAVGQLGADGRPVQRGSLFPIASMTKPITAAATLGLVDDGLLSLDESVERLLPELAGRRVLARMDGPLDETVQADRAITVRDLLTFTFGFGISFDMFMPTPWPIMAAAVARGVVPFPSPEPAPTPDPDEWIAALGSLPLMAQPGERWLYHTGASVLGVLIARAAGEPFPEVLRRRILEPLGMSDTAFWTAQPERLATSYRPTEDGGEWDPEDDASRLAAPVFPDGAYGLISTVDDLHSFSRMLLDGGAGVLTGTSVDAMTKDQMTAEQKARGGLDDDFFNVQSWSFCQAVRETGAFGWNGVAGTSWLTDPARDLTVVVLTQRLFEDYYGPAFHRELQAAAYAALS